jgi:hypothetical protein
MNDTKRVRPFIIADGRLVDWEQQASEHFLMKR